MPKQNLPFLWIIPNRRNRVGGYSEESLFYLEQDDWNDYGFKTTYHLHASAHVTVDKISILIGHVSILKEGQIANFERELQVGPIKKLDSAFCSMSNSLDYYERISQLPEHFQQELLTALRDILIYSDLLPQYRDEPGFKSSLMRGMTFKDDIFDLAPLLISRNFHKLFDLGLNFTFSMPELKTPIQINFDSPTFGFSDKKLPNRIAVIIGRNGSGKSTILSRISRIAFSSARDRRDKYLKTIGKISPPGLGFPRIILLSYSAFDAFNTPGIYKSDKETIITELKNGLGRYVFCGIRDIVRELESTLENIEPDGEGKLPRRYILSDRTENTLLKPISALADEFVRNLKFIEELDLTQHLYTALKILGEEKSMHEFAKIDLFENTDNVNYRLFMDMSTGHKFVIHAVTSIIAFAAPRSLLLFDEPETHLHPPILAALMKAIRKILTRRNSFMIVASHSPVVLQETLTQHTFVIRREGDLVEITQPEIETFGENVGILTQMVFGLNANVTDYHATLDKMVQEYSNAIFGNNNPEQILGLIEEVFPNGLSIQARAYVLAKILNQN